MSQCDFSSHAVVAVPGVHVFMYQVYPAAPAATMLKNVLEESKYRAFVLYSVSAAAAAVSVRAVVGFHP